MNISVNKDQYVIRFYYKTKEGKLRNISMTDKAWKTNLIKKSNFKILATKAVADRIEELDKEQEERIKEDETLKSFIRKFLDFDATMSKGTTSESKEVRLRKYLGNFYGLDTPVKEIFTTKNMMDYRLHIASLNLANETANHILITTKQFIDFLIASKAIDGGEGYSMKSSLVSLKKKEEDSLDDEEKVGENFWTKEEVYKFLDTFSEDDPYRFFFYISFWCATRLGETLGLKFSDFDEVEGTLSIARSRNNHARITTTKTSYSKAKITIPKNIFEQLKEYKKLVQSDSVDDYLFFPSCHASRTTIRRTLYIHADKAGLHHITPHGFRHSMASYLLANGFDYMDVCKYLRHSSPDITLKVYSHWIQKKGARTFREIEA